MFRTLMFVSLIAAASSWAQSAEATQAQSVVEKELLAPLRAKENKASRFSRAVLPAMARRVKMEDGAKTDANGKTFLSFTVEESRGWFDEETEGQRTWKQGFVGCVYADSKEVFVKKGETLVAGSLLLGKRGKAPVAGTCEVGNVVVGAK